jgi:hypothetical protein
VHLSKSESVATQNGMAVRSSASCHSRSDRAANANHGHSPTAASTPSTPIPRMTRKQLPPATCPWGEASSVGPWGQGPACSFSPGSTLEQALVPQALTCRERRAQAPRAWCLSTAVPRAWDQTLRNRGCRASLRTDMPTWPLPTTGQPGCGL